MKIQYESERERERKTHNFIKLVNVHFYCFCLSCFVFFLCNNVVVFVSALLEYRSPPKKKQPPN